MSHIAENTLRSVLELTMATVVFASSNQKLFASDFVTMGVGTATCAEFESGSRDSSEIGVVYFSWAQGLMSGFNIARITDKKPSVKLNAVSTEAQEASLKNYCSRNPMKSFMAAVLNLMGEIKAAE